MFLMSVCNRTLEGALSNLYDVTPDARVRQRKTKAVANEAFWVRKGEKKCQSDRSRPELSDKNRAERLQAEIFVKAVINTFGFEYVPNSDGEVVRFPMISAPCQILEISTNPTTEMETEQAKLKVIKYIMFSWFSIACSNLYHLDQGMRVRHSQLCPRLERDPKHEMQTKPSTLKMTTCLICSWHSFNLDSTVLTLYDLIPDARLKRKRSNKDRET